MAQQEDDTCCELITFCKQGWPDRRQLIIKGALSPYWQVRGDLILHENSPSMRTCSYKAVDTESKTWLPFLMISWFECKLKTGRSQGESFNLLQLLDPTLWKLPQDGIAVTSFQDRKQLRMTYRRAILHQPEVLPHNPVPELTLGNLPDLCIEGDVV